MFSKLIDFKIFESRLVALAKFSMINEKHVFTKCAATSSDSMVK